MTSIPDGAELIRQVILADATADEVGYFLNLSRNLSKYLRNR